jgi:hypothetical protein
LSESAYTACPLRVEGSTQLETQEQGKEETTALTDEWIHCVTNSQVDNKSVNTVSGLAIAERIHNKVWSGTVWSGQGSQSRDYPIRSFRYGPGEVSQADCEADITRVERKGKRRRWLRALFTFP